jgi:hypothetical protein
MLKNRLSKRTRSRICLRARKGNASKGYLSEIFDTTDKTSYLRDGFGRILKKTQRR